VTDNGDSPYEESWFSTLSLGSNSTYNLPFIPQFTTKGNYDNNSISLNGTHSTGDTEYDVHSLYSHGMMKATYSGVTEGNDQRPFVLTRGSFIATGQYASVAHYNTPRSYDSLYFGLTSVLRSQMFGISHSGADACGYYSGLTTELDEELCLRWY
jgi:alpha-glucosidase